MTLFSTARVYGFLCFFLFFLANALVFLLRNRPTLSYRIAYGIAVFLFLYKTGEYAYWQIIGRRYHFPMEFSALSYFLYGILITFRRKKAEEIGIFSAILAGSIYSIGFRIAPQAFVGDAESPFLFYMAMCNHHLLYLGGMLLVANTKRYSLKSIPKILLGVALCLLYCWSIYLFTPYASVEGKPLIIEICDGTVLLRVFSAPIPVWGTVLYYCGAIALLLVMAWLFCFLSQKCARRRQEKGIPLCPTAQ